MSTRPPFPIEMRASSSPPLALPRRQSAALLFGQPAGPFGVGSHPEPSRGSTRSPFGPGAESSAEVERYLRMLETQLDLRERDLAERELKLAERERDLAETAALLGAREKVMEAARNAGLRRQSNTVSPEEKAALEALRSELDRKEASLREQKVAMTERESFIEQNETRLFDKMQLQQEKETEIEQRLEELALIEERIRSMDPNVPVETQPETPSFPMDEFRE